MSDKLMYIPNEDTQNYHLFRLQLVVETFEHSNEPNNPNSIIVSKVVKLTN